jgi:hypothetical protein
MVALTQNKNETGGDSEINAQNQLTYGTGQ